MLLTEVTPDKVEEEKKKEKQQLNESKKYTKEKDKNVKLYVLLPSD